MRTLRMRGIRGVLVPQLPPSDGPAISKMPADEFTVVCLGFGWIRAPFHVVSTDMFQTTRMVWREVARRGYRRVGGAVLTHVPAALADAERIGASLVSQREFFPKGPNIPLLTSEPGDRAAFLRWMKRYRPDAVVGFIPTLYNWLIEEGWRVPEDVAMASLVVNPDESPGLSGCPRQERQVGAVGVDALIAAIGENEWGIPASPRKLLIEPSWHDAGSLPFVTAEAGVLSD
jgi:LacI family transcriptional regulator